MSDYYYTKSNQLSAPGDGEVIKCLREPMCYFGLQVTKVGNVTAWSADVQGSLDGVGFDVLNEASHTETDNGKIQYTGSSPKPVRQFKGVLNSFTGDPGSYVILSVIGVNR